LLCHVVRIIQTLIKIIIIIRREETYVQKWREDWVKATQKELGSQMYVCM
jgi:hypothetical protein